MMMRRTAQGLEPLGLQMTRGALPGIPLRQRLMVWTRKDGAVS
jgi:hypothetical protein